MLPAGDQVAVAGSYNSAVLSAPVSPAPPAISTFPFASSVAVCQLRASTIEPAADQVFVQLRALQEATAAVVGVAACHQNLAAREQRRRMVDAALDHYRR